MATHPFPGRTDFLVTLDQRFRARRLDLLSVRAEQAAEAAEPLADTATIRETPWKVVCQSGVESSAPSVWPRPWTVLDDLDGTGISATIHDVGTSLYDLAEARTSSKVCVQLTDVNDHREARVWNDVFDTSEQLLGLGRGRVQALVRVSSDRSCLEIDEILYELREHVVGVVNAAPQTSECYARVVATCERRGVELREAPVETETAAA